MRTVDIREVKALNEKLILKFYNSSFIRKEEKNNSRKMSRRLTEIIFTDEKSKKKSTKCISFY